MRRSSPLALLLTRSLSALGREPVRWWPVAGLADVVLDPGWLPRGGVVSVGDMVLVAGLVSWVTQSALAGARPRRARPA